MQRATIVTARVVRKIERLQEQASRLAAYVILVLDPQPKLLKIYIDIGKSKLRSSGLLHTAFKKGRCARLFVSASRVQLMSTNVTKMPSPEFELFPH